MNYIERLKQEVEKGFSKTYLETLIGLPKNTLASYLTGVKKMTPANEATTIKFLSKNPELDISTMPKRTRVIKIKADSPAAKILTELSEKKKEREIIVNKKAAAVLSVFTKSNISAADQRKIDLQKQLDEL